jgi:peptide/nickel transport system permease protein
MKGYFWFALKRALQTLVVIVVGISLAFLISQLSPIDPVERSLSRITSRSNFSPEAIGEMRAALTDLYGSDKSLSEQYVNFLRRMAQGDLGPSMLAFPTPAMDLVMRALPWTVFLLASSTLITFLFGNLLGAMAGYFQDSRLLKAFGVAAIGVQPIPYYIVAFMMLYIFGFVWPILPTSNAYDIGVKPGWNLDFFTSAAEHAVLPVASLIVVGFGTWFVGMRALVSNIVTEDYVTYAELGGVGRRRVLSSYVMRNAAVPQLTALALALGSIFSGTIITEQVYNYPGLGTLLVDAVNQGDSTTVLAVSTVAIVAVALAILVIDLLHPLLDPRVRTA